jgi:transcriptional regulator with XRE-family HTH domain
VFNFKECREKAGLTQKAAAISLKVSVQSISNWETGIRSPGLDQVIKLAELYGVTTDYLLGRTPMEIEVIQGEPPPLPEGQLEFVFEPEETPTADELERRIMEMVRKELDKYRKEG